jgi:hypothetical protein
MNAPGSTTPACRTGGRPQGELRKLIAATLRGGPPMAMRDIAARCQIGYKAAGQTIQAMKRAGQLVIAGYEKRPYPREYVRMRWVALYELADASPQSASEPPQTADLAAALSTWFR